MAILFAQNNNATTNSTQFNDIPGFTLVLPAGTATEKHALVILNIPVAFCDGPDVAEFGINFNGAIVASGGFNFPIESPVSDTFPQTESFTLVTRVRLGTTTAEVKGQWRVTNSRSTARIKSFSSFTATIT